MVICANCKKDMNHGEPKFQKDDEVQKVTISFCSEECMNSYR